MGPTGHFIKFCSVDKHLRRQLITFHAYRAELKGNLLRLILPEGTFAVFPSGHRVRHRVTLCTLDLIRYHRIIITFNV